MKKQINNTLFDKQLLKTGLVESFRKLDPRKMVRNPIMFTVEAVTAVMLLMLGYIAFSGDDSQGSFWYNLTVFTVLLLTVLFANFAEAIAEARGKAQADSLRKTREETPAKLVAGNGNTRVVSSSELKRGDVFECVAGDTIPADGEIIEGLASIDESAITGESATKFIRKIRFNYACKLLMDRKYSISEISSMVGFNSPSYFATSFKKHVGCLPTEYVRTRTRGDRDKERDKDRDKDRERGRERESGGE